MNIHQAVTQLISAKVELEYYTGFNQSKHIENALNDIDKAINILIILEEAK